MGKSVEVRRGSVSKTKKKQQLLVTDNGKEKRQHKCKEVKTNTKTPADNSKTKSTQPRRIERDQTKEMEKTRSGQSKNNKKLATKRTTSRVVHVVTKRRHDEGQE